MRSGAKVAIVSGVFAVVSGGVLYGGYQVVSGAADGGRAVPAAAERTGPPDAGETDRTARDFLAAWAAGEVERAASLTNDQASAQRDLAGLRDGAHLTNVTIEPGARSGRTVPYRVTAEVSYGGKTAPLAYAAHLTVVRGKTSHRPLVDWRPSVLHPKLRDGEYLVTAADDTPRPEVLDHAGRPLDPERYPSLKPVVDALGERYGSKVAGVPGVALRVQSESGGPRRTLLTLQKARAGTLRTTLDADLQAAAEKAVRQYGGSSVVAVRPSTGEIRAIADNRADGYNAALLGRVAPGSTMKIISAAMMIEHGVGGADRKAACPPTAAWEGYTFHNMNDFTIPDGTLTDAFARSCNTAFVKAAGPLRDKGVADVALGRTAAKYFGLGRDDWKAGVPTFDGSVPESSGAETAASYIGQGKVQMSPLAMASVTATVVDGRFRQPVLVPPELDGREPATAEPLPPAMARQLRQMMHAATVGQGTAVTAMAGVGGDKGAKTGSAEADGQNRSNSWFTGYSDDLAAAAMVQSGGHGGDAAGPIVAAVLRTE